MRILFLSHWVFITTLNTKWNFTHSRKMQERMFGKQTVCNHGSNTSTKVTLLLDQSYSLWGSVQLQVSVTLLITRNGFCLETPKLRSNIHHVTYTIHSSVNVFYDECVNYHSDVFNKNSPESWSGTWVSMYCIPHLCFLIVHDALFSVYRDKFLRPQLSPPEQPKEKPNSWQHRGGLGQCSMTWPEALVTLRWHHH
jgi:hypothetical protein